MIQLEYEYIIPFATLKEGKRAAADSLPTAVLYRNGVESGLAAPVSATATTGRYHVTFTTPAGWAKTDRLYLDVQATIDVEVFDEIIWDSFSEPDAVMRGTDGVDATLAKQDEILSAVAAVEGSDATLAKQEAILSAVGAIEPSLTGPFTRTITVTDSVSGDPIEGVSVRLSLAADTESQLTNASGVASFTVSTGTWSYKVFRSGYAGASGTVVVSGSGGTAVSLVANATPPASAPLCAVTLPIKDQYGQPLPATMVTLTFAGVTAGAAPAGIVMSPPPVQASDSAGIVQVDLIRLAKYTATYRIGTQTRQVSFTVPDAGSFLVTEV